MSKLLPGDGQPGGDQFWEGDFDATSILAYLNSKGCLQDAGIKPDNMRRVAVTLSNYKTLFTQQGGIVEYLARPGEFCGGRATTGQSPERG